MAEVAPWKTLTTPRQSAPPAVDSVFRARGMPTATKSAFPLRETDEPKPAPTARLTSLTFRFASGGLPDPPVFPLTTPGVVQVPDSYFLSHTAPTIWSVSPTMMRPLKGPPVFCWGEPTARWITSPTLTMSTAAP